MRARTCGPAMASRAPRCRTCVANAAESATLAGPHGRTAASHWALSGSAVRAKRVAQQRRWRASPTRRPDQQPVVAPPGRHLDHAIMLHVPPVMPVDTLRTAPHLTIIKVGLRRPRGRVVQVLMEDLAVAQRQVACALEGLGQRRRVGHCRAEVRHEIVYAVRVGAQTGEQAGARGRARRHRGVRSVEAHGLVGQRVHVRRDGEPVTVAAQCRPQVIDEYHQHVERRGGR